MSEESLTVMGVFAHPDDEIWTGAAFVHYAEEGVRTVLVIGTLGEEGEIHDPDLDPDEAKDRLGEIREAELRRSAEILQISQLHFLGYRDSGMAGTPANENPRNFHNADLEEATERLVRIIRREQPQVIVTDNEKGTYGHPDHLAAHRVTLAAFDAAGDPTRFLEAGPAWQPQKLYYAAFAREDFIRMREAMRAHGLKWGPEEESESDEFLSFTIPEELVTTRVRVAPYGHLVRQAVRAHRTQIPPDDPFFNMPEELMAEVMPTNTFVRARSLVDAPLPEDDLFAGLR